MEGKTVPVPPPVTRAVMPFTEKRLSTFMGAAISADRFY